MIILERSYLPHGTPGVLYLPGRSIVCLEPPWRDNQIAQSCIPEGRYTLERDHDGKHRYFRIPDEEVAPHSAVEVHIGNTLADTTACILRGLRFGVVNNQWAVLASKQACDLMLQLIPTPEVLWIRQYRPEGL